MRAKKTIKTIGSTTIMGILNTTPDSFSDGGTFYKNNTLHIDHVVKKALEMIDEGADIIDIGGESTGPASQNVSLPEELKRVIPVIKALRQAIKTNGRLKKTLISVDTYKAEVARQALEAGADIINDVTAFRGDANMAKTVAKYGVPIVIMYSKDPTARTTKQKTKYKNVIKTVKKFLEERISYGISQGIKAEQFIIDPGMGAFVSGYPKYSLEILSRLKEFTPFHLPLLIGASRKGFIGEVLEEKNKPLKISERLEGSLACAAVAVMNGANIIRTHDVNATRRMVDMIYKIKEAGNT